MSQLYPGHERRVRRFGFACILAALATALVVGGVLLHEVYGLDVPRWLWLVPFVSGYALGAVSLVVMFSFLRELRHLRRQ
jgi:hypothetical protein